MSDWSIGGIVEQTRIIELLKDFLASNIQIDELSETVDDWLFDFRQKPESTPEQELLSNLELYIHEAKEGYRSWDELYEYMLSVISRDISERFVTTITLNTSSISEFCTTSKAIPVKDYHRDLLLV